MIGEYLKSICNYHSEIKIMNTIGHKENVIDINIPKTKVADFNRMNLETQKLLLNRSCFRVRTLQSCEVNSFQLHSVG